MAMGTRSAKPMALAVNTTTNDMIGQLPLDHCVAVEPLLDTYSQRTLEKQWSRPIVTAITVTRRPSRACHTDRMPTLSDFSARATDGTDVDLAAYAGQVVLVVNTASECGFATQLPGLQRLHDEYADRGFSVLGFPSDQFRQEPLADEEMPTACERNFGVSFPIFAKVAVNGRDTHPLYRWLRSQRKGLLGGRINWNFTKFLIDRDGRVVARYGPTTAPGQLNADIETVLGVAA